MVGLRVVNGDDSGDEFDPFKLDSNGYSENNFYTSSGGRNNSESKNVRMPLWMIGELGELIASRKIPAYKTEPDFWRDAGYHRLKKIAVILGDNSMDKRINLEVEMSRITADADDINKSIAIVDKYEETAAQCVSMGDKDKLEEVLDKAEHICHELRPAYQGKLRGIIKQYRLEAKKMKD